MRCGLHLLLLIPSDINLATWNDPIQILITLIQTLALTDHEGEELEDGLSLLLLTQSHTNCNLEDS